MKFFGWTWVAAAFADDDIGQSGRYSFAQFTDSGLYFPCFYIIGTQNDAGLSALSNCIKNYTDIQILLLWGAAPAIGSSIKYLYDNTNLTYLTFVINPTAAISIDFNILPVPTEFYQGSIFLSENYDQDTGFYDCLDRFVNDPSSASEVARKAYEKDYRCIIGDDSLPRCKAVNPDKNEGKCKCLIEDYNTVSKPYTVIIKK